MRYKGTLSIDLVTSIVQTAQTALMVRHFPCSREEDTGCTVQW